MPSVYPHLFDQLPSFHRETQLYTQRRSLAEAPENYRFTVEELALYLIGEFGLITVDTIGYLHLQDTLSVTWTINHNLNRLPLFQAYDPDDIHMFGDTQSSGLNTLILNFNVPVEGYVILR